MKRRILLGGLAATALFPLAAVRGRAAEITPEDVERMGREWRRLLPDGARIAESLDPVERSAEDWRNRLDGEAYRILFEEGTERAGSSPLNEEKRPGVYVCAACDLPLFTSEMKYDSGTGWPSFFTHIPDHFGTKLDFKLVWPRTEYHCAKCGGHHGHVFDDGPPPTGKRWCNNGLALRFIPAAT